MYRSRLTADPSTVERTVDSASIFGVNHRYAFNGYGSFDPDTMRVKDDFTALYKQVGFGSIRYPGGTISNLFNWKTTIGPRAQRLKQIHGFYNNPGQAASNRISASVKSRRSRTRSIQKSSMCTASAAATRRTRRI